MVKASRSTHSGSNLLSIRDARRTRRSKIRDSIHLPPIIYIDYDPIPNEIIEALQSKIGPSVEINYEELAPPDIIEIYHEQSRAPISIPFADANHKDRSSEISHNSDASLSFTLLDELEARDTPLSTSIGKTTPGKQLSIEYSPSYSLLPSPLLESKEDINDSLGDIIPGLLDFIPDKQLLNLIKDFDWTFLDETNL